MQKVFRGKKFVAGATRESIEKFVINWLNCSNLKAFVTFEVKDVYYHYLDLVPILTNYLERFLKIQLEGNKRSWVIFSQKQLFEIYRKYLDFYHWESCEGIGTQYRRK